MNNNLLIKGFTMIELIIVISITSILAITLFIFIKGPISAYDQSQQRAIIVDEAHTIMKKIKRDIQNSVPNSVRIQDTGNQIYIELVSINAAGQYRTQLTSSGTGNILDFTTSTTQFDMLNGSYTFSGGEKIVINNLGIPNYDIYAGDTFSLFNGTLGVPTSLIKINSKKFPLESNGNKFYIANDVVTYVCDRVTKQIVRYNGYSIQASQPIDVNSSPLSRANKAILGLNISNCSFVYAQGSNSRNLIVSIFIQLLKNQQKISLYGETYVPNS